MAPFRKRFDAPRLTREEAERQGRAVRVTQDVLIDPDAVRAFLNTHHDVLGGRPIDLAVASADGLAAVERAVTDQPRSNTNTP